MADKKVVLFLGCFAVMGYFLLSEGQIKLLGLGLRDAVADMSPPLPPAGGREKAGRRP